MKTFIKKRMLDKHMSADTISERIGAKQSSFYRSLKSDMRVSRLFAVAQAMGYQLGFFDPKEKRFHKIEASDIEEKEE